MATVFLARQTDLDRLVALKELSAFRQSDPAFSRRFLRESQLAGSLSHPNIVTVHDYFEHRGTPYIAMEYVEGGSLRPWIGQLSLTQVAGVLEGILAALDHAGRRHIVHRDLKPENVMVTSDGRVKITDFGIAKATGKAQTGSFMTATGSTVGTPNYMAPEQAMGREVGPRTDLYSVGVMAFEIFVGKVPFHETEEPMAVLMRQVSDEIPPASSLNPEVDPALSDWIERLLVKDPDERTASAHEAGDELEEIVIHMVGPRWRRSSRLLDDSRRPGDVPAGPATPPPSVAARPPLMPSMEVPSRPPARRRRTTLSEAPTRRLREEEDRAGARTVMPEAPTRKLEQPKPGRRRRLLRLLAVAVLLLLAMAAALGGRGSKPVGSRGGPVAVPTSTVTGPDLALRVPKGWSRRRRSPDLGLPMSSPVAVAARRRVGGPVVEFGSVRGGRAANSTLLPAGFLGATGQKVGTAPPHTAMRLPAQRLEAWRYRDLRPGGMNRSLTVYTVPTTLGVATVACAVPAGQAQTFAAQCEAIAGTLQLRRGSPYPIGPNSSYAGTLNTTMESLQQTTRSEEANIQSAQTLAGQAAAARALASAYEGAAAQLAGVDLSPADREANANLVTALRGAAAAYGKAARLATARDRGAYLAASGAIPGKKQQVNTALAGVRAAGYKPASRNRGTSTSRKSAPPQSDVGDSRSDDPSDDSANP